MKFNGWNFPCSNENLLINPRFIINQRGATEYTSDGYTVDGWKINNMNLTVNSDSSITIQRRTADSVGMFMSPLELINFSTGDQVVFSVMTGDGKIYKSKGETINIEDTDTDGFTIGNFIFDVYKHNTQNYVSVRIFTFADEPITLKAAKLEFGIHSTLDLDMMKNVTVQMTEEWLEKCKRYFQVYNNTSLSLIANTAWYASTIFDLDVEMRETPTFSYSGTVSISDNGGNDSAEFSKISMYSGHKKRPLIRGNTNSGKLTAGGIYILSPLTLMFSSEL